MFRISTIVLIKRKLTIIDDKIQTVDVLHISYLNSSRRCSSCESREIFSHANKNRFRTEHVYQTR